MKNQGFSLIEVCIGIALVGIMIGIGGPKIRRYIASGKDTKAIATLALRFEMLVSFITVKLEIFHLKKMVIFKHLLKNSTTI